MYEELHDEQLRRRRAEAAYVTLAQEVERLREENARLRRIIREELSWDDARIDDALATDYR